MPSITDVLNEKYGTSGSNIAEAIEQANGGSGSGADSGVVVVELEMDAETQTQRINKTARECVDLVAQGKLLAFYYARESSDNEAGIHERVNYLFICSSTSVVTNTRTGEINNNGVTITFWKVYGVNFSSSIILKASGLDEYPHVSSTTNV